MLSGGNFHGEPLAIAMDYLGMAMAELGNIAERRIMRLTDEASNAHVLPAFLTRPHLPPKTRCWRTRPASTRSRPLPTSKIT